MGPAEIVGFVVFGVLMAAVLLWGALTERRRGPAPRPEWTVVDTVEDAPGVEMEGRVVVAAWLAARGLDAAEMAESDILAQRGHNPDGRPVIHFLVRTSALARRNTRR